MGEDVREGAHGDNQRKAAKPAVRGQTKTKLGNSEIRTLVENVVSGEAGNLPGRKPVSGQGHRREVHHGFEGQGKPRGREGNDKEGKSALGATTLPGSWLTALRRTLRFARYIS